MESFRSWILSVGYVNKFRILVFLLTNFLFRHEIAPAYLILLTFFSSWLLALLLIVAVIVFWKTTRSHFCISLYSDDSHYLAFVIWWVGLNLKIALVSSVILLLFVFLSGSKGWVHSWSCWTMFISKATSNASCGHFKVGL